jgi:two-component system phosphate regulon sensor histidine kinase PhoR
VDGLVIALFGLFAIGLAVVIALLLDRERTLTAARHAAVPDRTATGGRVGIATRGVRDRVGGPRRPDIDPTAELPTLVRQLRHRLDAVEFELDQQVRNAAYLADLMGVGIVWLDERGVVEIANAAARGLLGSSAGPLRGRTAIEAFVDRRVEELISTARETGAASGEFRPGGADGPILIIRARRSPVRGVWVVLEDVTELRRLQQIRTEFVDNLSHELRTPLSTVSLLAETLAREAETAGEAVPARMRDRIGKIEVETGHLVQMVNELLDLARIEGGGPLTNMDDVDLGRIAPDAAERLRLFAERQGLRLDVAVAPGLPHVRGDEARLGQVVVNLVHNALKFGRPEASDDAPGSRTLATVAAPVSTIDRPAEVVVAVDAVAAAESGLTPEMLEPGGGGPTGRVVRLRVIDHGVGIAAADQPRIFERFYKVDRVRVRGGGTGLGLAIARHVIQQHGGRIEVSSEEGRGSTFTVTLPAVEDAIPAA